MIPTTKQILQDVLFHGKSLIFHETLPFPEIHDFIIEHISRNMLLHSKSIIIRGIPFLSLSSKLYIFFRDALLSTIKVLFAMLYFDVMEFITEFIF